MELVVLDELYEEKVEGIGMKSKQLVVLDDKNMGLVSLDSSKDGDTGEEISKDMEINRKSWVAFDSYCMGSEINTGTKIQDDTVSDVPSLFQSNDHVYKSMTPSWKEKVNNDFKKANGSNFVDLVVKENGNSFVD
ncbi:hypothetical protein CTI12_AA411070 [Artemisia annua]|uniref:Uncharacterized protein n=1 Tax=Artemisia annua TaxID=35608 RepID=A0A2U1M6D3_ARTAN|nr:hypothetical protein CTI12_AA411070 [Artemisia annua]